MCKDKKDQDKKKFEDILRDEQKEYGADWIRAFSRNFIDKGKGQVFIAAEKERLAMGLSIDDFWNLWGHVYSFISEDEFKQGKQLSR